MDSSNSAKVRIALGEERVRLSDLTLEEMVCIFRKTIASVKPNLKYLPGFNPIHEILDRIGDGGQSYTEADSCLEFSDGISVRTKIAKVDTLFRSYKDEKTCRTGELWLTDEGGLVIWSGQYRRLERVVDGNRVLSWEATSSKFELIAPEKIEEHLDGKQLGQKLLLLVIRTICRLSARGLTEREERIKGIRYTMQKTNTVFSNIVTE